MELPTTERLARALETATATTADPRLRVMIERAREGYYDDYKSPLTLPCAQLVNDLMVLGLHDLAQRARSGEFDATAEEAAEWARSPEGVATINEVYGIGGGGRGVAQQFRRRS